MAAYDPNRLVQPLAHAVDFYEQKLALANWRESVNIRAKLWEYYDHLLGIPRSITDMTDADIAHVNATNRHLRQRTGNDVPELSRPTTS